jgi:hypothetical protein
VPPPEVVELRQYTLQPGRRDDLIEIFERHLIAGQEEAGARIIGHFRDLEHPDRFVWLRAFRDMPSRKLALEALYGSGVWHEHRDAVNEMIDDAAALETHAAALVRSQPWRELMRALDDRLAGPPRTLRLAPA